METSKEALEKFKRLYLKHYGIELTDERADELYWALLGLIEAASQYKKDELY